MIPWGLTPARAGILAGVVLAAFVAGGVSAWFLVASPRIDTARETARADVATLQAEVQLARADGERAGRAAQTRANEKAQEASDERARELARLAGLAATRPPVVVRVCPPGAGPVPAPGGDPAGAAPGDSPPGGLLPGPAAEDPGAVLGRQLDELALEADRVSADLRAVVAACGG